jgi:hypothetical protein
MSSSIISTLSTNKLLDSGHNWVVYKGRLLLAVQQCCLSNRLSKHTELKPAMYPQTEGANSIYVEDLAVVPPVVVGANLVKERIKEIDIWESQEATMIHFMVCSILNRLVNQLLALSTAKECWDLLSSIFETKSEFTKQDLQQSLNSLSCPEGANIHTHIDAMVKIHLNLTAMGEVIDDQTFRSTLTISLPRSLDQWQHLLNISNRTLRKPQTSQNFIDQVLEQLEHQTIFTNSHTACNTNNAPDSSLDLMFTRLDP